ncbi:hypothetical protein KP509_03G077600 [Ceratopteris richardii]|uniref:Uncharacterized protein n=1 Tax=Ceratopteris richardii TaxID=49495 RepID=A0A8T2V5B3_CERRI|nr:hypothetical protein KP509_03G077600 [Ceratopteris richardii]
MSLQHDEKEEGPGAFLSLSGAQGSSSPFRVSPAEDLSPRITSKREQGHVETYLSLQQPSPNFPHESVHAQELRSGEMRGSTDPPNNEKTFDGQNEFTSFRQASPLQALECKGIWSVESEKSAFSEPKESTYSEQEKHVADYIGNESSASAQVMSEPSRLPASWLEAAEPKRFPTSSTNAQQNIMCLPDNTGENIPFVSSDPLQMRVVSGQNRMANPLSLQVSPKREEQMASAKAESLPFSTRAENHSSFQTSPIEPLAVSTQRPVDFPLESEGTKYLPAPSQEQKVSTGLSAEHVSFTLLHASSEQQQISPTKQIQRSPSIHTHVDEGPVDQHKGGSIVVPSTEKKTEYVYGMPAQMTNFDAERMQRNSIVSYSDTMSIKQDSMGQTSSALSEDRTGFSSKPNASTTHTNNSAFLGEKELKFPMQSPFARLTSTQGIEICYPFPMATHEAVCSDRRLFMETLQCLHAALNWNLNLPKVVGGVEVDLHRLYNEVTNLGGLELVINHRKWEDIAQALGCFSNLVNASPVLEQTYINTLHHYEQVYFRRAIGRLVSPPAAISSQNPVLSDKKELGDFYGRNSTADTVNGDIESAQALAHDPGSSVGAVVSGAIDGKFDDGYLVTVMVGTRKLRGVLYHVTSKDTQQNTSTSSIMQSVNSGREYTDMVPKMGRKRQKREVFRKDPNAPRQNRTGYNFFFAEQRAKLKTMQPDKDRAISKMIGELWSKLSEDERIPYQVKGVKDKERYVREMKEYKERIKMPRIISNDIHNVPLLHSQRSRTNAMQQYHEPSGAALLCAFPYTQERSGNTESMVTELPCPMGEKQFSKVSTEPVNKIMEAQMLQSPAVSGAASFQSNKVGVEVCGKQVSLVDCQKYPSPAVAHAVTMTAISGPTIGNTMSSSIPDQSATARTAMSNFFVDEGSPKGFSSSERPTQTGPTQREIGDDISVRDE